METPLASLSNTELVEGIRRKDYRVINEFYRRFERGLHYLIARMGTRPQDIDDIVHDSIFLVVSHIQTGDKLQNPECLPGYVRTLARRAACDSVRQSCRFYSLDHQRLTLFKNTEANCPTPMEKLVSPEATPEQAAISGEQAAIMREALAEMRPDEVELLTRFYLKDQKPVQIIQEMGLTPTQFRLNKSRAKQRLADAVHKKMAGRSRQRLIEKIAA